MHVQLPYDPNFVRFAIDYLDGIFPYMSQFSSPLSHDETMLLYNVNDHVDKASGYPWVFLGCPTKGQCVDKHPDFYKFPISVLNCTLKDELRLIGKDARLFRPASAHDYYTGLRLFSRSNEYMQSCLISSPMFTKFVHPGTHVSTMFRTIRDHNGDKYDADGASWDANFGLSLAEIILTWRLRHAPVESHADIVQYYRSMYNGWTNVGGVLYHLIGQPSGHFCTTVDNTLGSMICMCYNAYRHNIPLGTFSKEVLFYSCGDDLIWSDRTGLFTPEQVFESYKSFGCYLEFGSLEPLDLVNLSFVGQSPVYTDHGLQYHGKVDKTRASVLWCRRSATVVDKLQKLVACAINMRWSPDFQYYSTVISSYFGHIIHNHLASLEDPSIKSLIKVSHPDHIARLYTRLENGLVKEPPFKCLLSYGSSFNFCSRKSSGAGSPRAPDRGPGGP